MFQNIKIGEEEAAAAAAAERNIKIKSEHKKIFDRNQKCLYAAKERKQTMPRD